MLALLGADVIKVESVSRPDGMRMRGARPFREDLWWETGPSYHGGNAGKRGTTLDLGSKEGRELLLELVSRSDILVENFTPRVMASWGLTYDILRAARPDLIPLVPCFLQPLSQRHLVDADVPGDLGGRVAAIDDRCLPGSDPRLAGRSARPAVTPPERPVLAIVVAMSIVEQMSLADVKNRLSEVVDSVEREHGRVVITRHGRPAAIVISVDDLESLEETLAVMGSTQLMADVREALDDLDEAGTTVLTKDEALRLATGR